MLNALVHKVVRFVLRLAAKAGLKSAFVYSIVNQVFASATNLLLGLFLVHGLTQSEFGMYSIAFAVIISVGAIANSLFLLPMTVDMPHGPGSVRRTFMYQSISAVALVMIVTSVAAVASTSLVAWSGWLAKEQVVFVAALCFAAVLYVLKECFIQAAYNETKERAAVYINVATAGSVFTLLLTISKTPVKLTAVIALIVYGISQGVSMFVGYRLIFKGEQLQRLSMTARHAVCQIKRGLWPAASGAIALGRTQAHTISAAALLGPIGVAQINAARLMFAPIQTIQPALVRVAMPRLVRSLQKQPAYFESQAKSLIYGLAVISAIFGASVLAVGPYLYHFVVSDKYEYDKFIFLAWSLVFLLTAIRSGFELRLQALKRFVDLTKIGLITTVVALVTVFLLTAHVGAAGALLGVAIGEAVNCACLLVISRSHPIANAR